MADGPACSRAVGGLSLAKNAAVAEGCRVKILLLTANPAPGFTHRFQCADCTLTIAAAHPTGAKFRGHCTSLRSESGEVYGNRILQIDELELRREKTDLVRTSLLCPFHHLFREQTPQHPHILF